MYWICSESDAEYIISLTRVFRGRLKFQQYLSAKPNNTTSNYGKFVTCVMIIPLTLTSNLVGRPTGPGGNETHEVELGKKMF